jgi:hypothetical protein
MSFIKIFENTDQLAYLLSTIFVYIPYIQTLLLPIICLFFMPAIIKKLRILVAAARCGRIFGHNNPGRIITEQFKTATVRPI